jgi:hypothetical protein
VVLPDRHVGSLDVASRPIKRRVTPITRTHAPLGCRNLSPPRGKPEGLGGADPRMQASSSLPLLDGLFVLC